MPSNEIITGLKNAIERNETLENAMQIMINSGYSPEEVQEASKFVTGGALNYQEPREDEQLTMPDQKKSFFSRLKFWKRSSKQNQQEPQTSSKTFEQQENQQLQQSYQGGLSIQNNLQQQRASQFQEQPPAPHFHESKIKGSLVRELKNIKPKRSYTREIILFIILILLLGVLGGIYLFKDRLFG